MLIFPLSINADRVLPNTCIISCNGRSLAVISVELLSAEATIGAGRLVIAYVYATRASVEMPSLLQSRGAGSNVSGVN